MNMLLKFNYFIDRKESVLKRLFVEQLEDKYSKTPYTNLPRMLIFVNVFKPLSVEVFILIFETIL